MWSNKEITTRLWLGGDQAHRGAESPPKASDPEMDASSIGEKNRKRGTLPAKFGSSGGHASAAKTTARKRPENDSRGTWCIPGSQGSEPDRSIQCDGHRGSTRWRRQAPLSVPFTQGFI